MQSYESDPIQTYREVQKYKNTGLISVRILIALECLQNFNLQGKVSVKWFWVLWSTRSLATTSNQVAERCAPPRVSCIWHVQHTSCRHASYLLWRSKWWVAFIWCNFWHATDVFFASGFLKPKASSTRNPIKLRPHYPAYMQYRNTHICR